MSTYYDRLLDDLDPAYRQELEEQRDLAWGAPEYTRGVEDYCPASGLWYGADVIAKASRKEAT